MPDTINPYPWDLTVEEATTWCEANGHYVMTARPELNLITALFMGLETRPEAEQKLVWQSYRQLTDPCYGLKQEIALLKLSIVEHTPH